jgi:hypothetical protein
MKLPSDVIIAAIINSLSNLLIALIGKSKDREDDSVSRYSNFNSFCLPWIMSNVLGMTIGFGFFIGFWQRRLIADWLPKKSSWGFGVTGAFIFGVILSHILFKGAADARVGIVIGFFVALAKIFSVGESSVIKAFSTIVVVTTSWSIGIFVLQTIRNIPSQEFSPILAYISGTAISGAIIGCFSLHQTFFLLSKTDSN